MIKLFEDYTTSIINKSFVKNGLLPTVDFDCFSRECMFDDKNNFKKVTSKLSYANIMRFYLYMYLLKYKGNDEHTLLLIDKLKSKDVLYCEILNKFGMNQNVRNYISFKFKLGILSNRETDIRKLDRLDSHVLNIFTDENLKIYTEKLLNSTAAGKKSEDISKKIFRDIFKKFDVEDPKRGEDVFGDIDVWLTNKITKNRIGLQVKGLGGELPSKLIANKKSFTINNTALDLKSYNKEYQKLKYDYLVIIDNNINRMYMVKSNLINSINLDPKNRSLYINLDVEVDDKLIRKQDFTE